MDETEVANTSGSRPHFVSLCCDRNVNDSEGAAMSLYNPPAGLIGLALVVAASGCGRTQPLPPNNSATPPMAVAKTRLEPQLISNTETTASSIENNKTPSDPMPPSGKFDNGLVLEIRDLRLTSDNLLRVDFEISNPTADTIDTRLSGFRFWNNLYYVEEGGRHKASVAKAGGECFASNIGWRKFAPHKNAMYWVKFPLPHKGIRRVSFYFDGVEPIEDVLVPTGMSSTEK
jgi:hypothetical protein